jgi:hypothetical protein
MGTTKLSCITRTYLQGKAQQIDIKIIVLKQIEKAKLFVMKNTFNPLKHNV